MNIDDLKISELKEIAKLACSLGVAGGLAAHDKSPFIGQHVIIRTYSAGVHAGFLESRVGDIAVLRDARRLWSWTARSGIALSGLAVHGLKSGKVDAVLPLHELIGVIEVIPTSRVAQESINGA